jgi:hypothetical protein
MAMASASKSTMQRSGVTGSNVSGRMDTTNRNTALASALVEELARCGVRHAVVSPGSRSTPIALALWRQPAIEVTVLLDERSAGFFAVGAAQAGCGRLHLWLGRGEPPPRGRRGR